MRHNNYFYLIIIITLSISSCYKEMVVFNSIPNEDLELPLVLSFDHKDCFYDHNSKSFRFSIVEDSIENFSPFIEFQEHSSVFINNIPLTNNATNNLGTIKTKETYKVSITTLNDTKEFSLRFTILPTVRIVSHNKFKDDPKLLARMTIYAPNNQIDVINSFIGIELRGSSSQKNPKKSYGFTFLKDKNITNKVSKGLFGWKENEDWILDAVYNDQAKFRNKFSFEIWKAMNPAKHISIKSKFVELYLNNDYLGLYCLNEKINVEQLNSQNSKHYLYKTITWNNGTLFNSLPTKPPSVYSDLWDGFQQKSSSLSQQVEWQPLYDLRDWAVNSSDQDFINNTSTFVDLENIIDYLIFINLIGAFDNHGKNIFWVNSNTKTPFSIIPWDLDSSWGRDWDGDRILPLRIVSDDNALFKRLLTLNPDDFKTKLKTRWNDLRATLATTTNLNLLLNNQFEQLMRTDVISLENARWGQGLDLYNEHAFIQNWLGEQLDLLDEYFDNM